MDKVKQDAVVTCLVCLAVGAFVFYQTLQYPEVKGQGFGQGPAFYPQILAFSIMFLGGLHLFQGLKSPCRQEPDQVQRDFRKPLRFLPVCWLMFIAVVLVSLLDDLGFYVAGFLLTYFAALVIRGRISSQKLLVDFLFSIGIMVVVYLLFELFVGFELPGSIWFD